MLVFTKDPSPKCKDEEIQRQMQADNYSCKIKTNAVINKQTKDMKTSHDRIVALPITSFQTFSM